jgi:hypothetical protein
MIPDSQRGDSRRHFIGGVDALYRPVAYRGEWEDGKRTGQGIVVYASGLEMAGELIDGRFEGIVKYVYPESKRVRFAMFRGGDRISWMSAKDDLVVDSSDCTNAETILEEMLGPASKSLALFHQADKVPTDTQSVNSTENKNRSPNRVLFADD